jgi:hypothetical protein
MIRRIKLSELRRLIKEAVGSNLRQGFSKYGYDEDTDDDGVDIAEHEKIYVLTHNGTSESEEYGNEDFTNTDVFGSAQEAFRAFQSLTRKNPDDDIFIDEFTVNVTYRRPLAQIVKLVSSSDPYSVLSNEELKTKNRVKTWYRGREE